MPEMIINPRLTETDALGHINNTVSADWFETGRIPIFRVFVPSLDPRDWTLILRRTEYDFLQQLYYGRDVIIRTRVASIGHSSLTVEQEAWQDERVAVRGRAVLVHFDYQTNQKKPIPEALRAQLEELV